MKLQHMFLEKLGEFLGFHPTEALFRDGRLTIDNLDMAVSQIHAGDHEFVALAVEIASIPPRHLQSILTLAMSANHCWRGTAGATFSFDPISEQLYLAQRFSSKDVLTLQIHEIGQEVLRLFEASNHWQAVVGQLDFAEQPLPLHGRAAHALSFGLAAARLQ